MQKLSTVKDEYVKGQDYEKAAEMRDKVNELKHKMRDMKENWKKGMNQEIPIIEKEDIAKIIAFTTGIPVNRIAESESLKLLKMEDELHEIGRASCRERV